MHQCLELPHIICSICALNIVDEVLMVDTNRIIRVPDIDFDEFLCFIGIWLLITGNPGTNQTEYFSENYIDLFSGCSIFVNHIMYGNHFENNCSDLKFSDRPPSFQDKSYEVR